MRWNDKEDVTAGEIMEVKNITYRWTITKTRLCLGEFGIVAVLMTALYVQQYAKGASLTLFGPYSNMTRFAMKVIPIGLFGCMATLQLASAWWTLAMYIEECNSALELLRRAGERPRIFVALDSYERVRQAASAAALGDVRACVLPPTHGAKVTDEQRAAVRRALDIGADGREYELNVRWDVPVYEVCMLHGTLQLAVGHAGYSGIFINAVHKTVFVATEAAIAKENTHTAAHYSRDVCIVHAPLDVRAPT